jgi:Ca2+-binding RTX toxin-like protein
MRCRGLGRLWGRDGPDEPDGGAGDDPLLGGADLLSGGPGDDWLFGGPGHDDLDGGTGRNHLIL